MMFDRTHIVAWHWSLTIISASLLLADHANAQSCDIGRYGMYEFSSESSQSTQANSFRRLFCQQNFSSAGQAQSFAGTLGIPIDGIPVQMGSSTSDSSFHKSYISFCDDQAYQSEYRTATESYARTISKVVVDAMHACLTQPGLHAWIELTPDQNIFYFKTRFNHSADSDKNPEVRNFDAGAAVCQTPPIVGSLVDVAGTDSRCTRASPQETVAISFNADHKVIFDTPLVVPGVQVRSPEPIEISAAEYIKPNNSVEFDEQCLHNGPPKETGKPNYADYEILNVVRGRYLLEIRYFMHVSRSVAVMVNGEKVDNVLGGTPPAPQWQTVGAFNLHEGRNILNISRSDVFPHICAIRFTPQ